MSKYRMRDVREHTVADTAEIEDRAEVRDTQCGIAVWVLLGCLLGSVLLGCLCGCSTTRAHPRPGLDYNPSMGAPIEVLGEYPPQG